MRRLAVPSGAIAAAVFVAAACSGGPAATSLPTVLPINVPSVAIPSIAVPSIAVPSIAVPTLPTGSFAIPSFALPSYNTNADPDLAARFPQQVAGQPVKEVQTVNFVEFYQAFGAGDEEAQANLQAFVQLLASNGINAATLSFGSGNTTVNDESVLITALRTPGVPATTLISLWPQLAAISATDETPPVVGQANVGGKAVTTFTDSDGNVDYLYPSGDVVWSLDTTNPDEATAVFSALQ